MRAGLARLILVAGALALAGCATRTRAPAIAVSPAPIVALAPPLPPGASPGMVVPQPLADGGFPTPNRALTSAGTLWHLRAGLNVAALSCGGEQGAAIRAGYNRWLAIAKAPLAGAATRYAAEYGATLAGRDAFDDAMTRLYNFFSQTPARPAFCAAAAETVAALPSGDIAGFAATRLPELDRPFVDFYRAYEAWREGAARRTVPPLTMAAVSPADAGAVSRGPGGLVLDTSRLPIDPATTAAR